MSIVMYRIQDREVANGKVISSETNYEAHYYHANDNKSKVLFTTPRLGSSKEPNRINPKQIIIAKSETEQFIGDIVQMGKMQNIFPSLAVYDIPSQWKNRIKDYEKKENYAWYEVDNLRELTDLERDSIISNGYNKVDKLVDVFKDTTTYKSPIYLI